MLENLGYLETLYSRFQADPKSVPDEWREYFDKADPADGNGNGAGHDSGGAPFENGERTPEQALLLPGRTARNSNLDQKLHLLIRNYRVRGHRIAAIDPLGAPRPMPPELELDFYNFSERELNQLVQVPTLHFATPLTIREIYERLRRTYCGSIGAQFMHIDDMETRHWLQRRMESTENHIELSRQDQVRIFTRLTDAVVFEEFLQKKFLGAKTFSLEGCETLIPLLDLAIEKAASQGILDIVLGMAHRGRLNVLANIAGKNPCEIFREFADLDAETKQGRGDVKYHLGHSGRWTTADGKKIHLSLCFNPSHLEFINPVAMGRTRARQDRFGDPERKYILSLLIHGDASFAGEGVVQETLNLSKLAGYSVGGTLHIIINNQIGFTTMPNEYRSSVYSTSVARMLRAPIFHVNGEDPEAVAQVVSLSLDFQRQFKNDVFIDMYGYRRRGHNETDEPSFTQPVLYRQIEKRKGVQTHYREHLLKLNGLTAEEAEKISRGRHDKLEKQLEDARKGQCAFMPKERGVWQGYTGGPEPKQETDTGLAPEKISDMLGKLATVPDGFHLHPKLQKNVQARREMAEGRQPLDWAAAEALALGSLATQGIRIRLAGQDSVRGTFSHRHAYFYDYENGSPYCPMQHLDAKQAPVEIVNSSLCEAGALGFEYGYSLDYPDGLILWEAQFGDFVNVAQVILDQFITSAEDKWNRLSGLVLLLPHGFEGMGPEHSSARLERFLTLAAENNIQITQPSTPAQLFHLFRRQIMRKWRKPLVVLTPKSLLRHPRVISPRERFTGGHFQRIIADPLPAKDTKRVLVCSGKIYYELLAYREEQKRNDVAIVRLEQLYPLHDEALEETLEPYAEKIPVLWVQEEPQNMGAWRFLHEKFGKHLFGRWPFAVVARAESASPATGSHSAHKLEQQRLIRRAFGDSETAPAKAQKAAAK
ncbi:MAG TPA: 2-oxoglutarate dehydrogenase E1 component [Verrucomicrobiae bacterium]|jgi:2-oxoglutarate dehydrogenase E1 component